jgi:hypothetical protein
MAALRRISIGFQAGQVLALRVSDAQLKTLYKALQDGGWHELESEDGPVRLYFAKVVYVRGDDEVFRIEFG